MEWWRKDNPEHDHWRQIEREKSRVLWQRVFSVLEFSTRKIPRIKQIDPFIRWSTLHLTNSLENYQELYSEKSDYYKREHETREYLFNVFLKIRSRYGNLFALDLNHECYRFEPNFNNVNKLSWPIKFIPDGSGYILFVPDELDCGFYCDPRDKLVCAFGGFLFSIFDYNEIPCRGEILQSSFPKLGRIPKK